MARFRFDGYDLDRDARVLAYFDAFFSPYRDQPVRLLELGSRRAGSLLAWRDYFPAGQIVGISTNSLPDLSEMDRIVFLCGDVTAPQTYENLDAVAGTGMFDIVIDNASHIGSQTKAAMDLLLPSRVTPGGFYVVESWGTGYWPSWPDGRAFEQEPVTTSEFPSHTSGCVGMLKQLVDDVAAGDIRAGGVPFEGMPIEFITIAHGLAILRRNA